MMKNTFRDNGQNYVKLKMKKTSPSSYANAMTLQNRYLSLVRTITVVGITRSTMKILKQSLLELDTITYVAATTKTDTIGRWDIITMSICRERVQTWLEANLEKLLAECPPESVHDRPEQFPEPSIQSRNARMTEEDSSQGDVSYLSSSAGSYDSVAQEYTDQAEYQEEPSNGIIQGKTWAQAVARNPQTPNSTTSSHPTQSNISELTTPTAAQQNKRYGEMEKRLQEEILGMRADMQRMLARMEAEEAAEAAKANRAPEPIGSQFQYPPLGINGYNTNYHLHAASPGYNYQNMYQGYPSGYPSQSQSQPYESPMRGHVHNQHPPQPIYELQPRHPDQYRAAAHHPEAGDLNKRSLASPSFNDVPTERGKRIDHRDTPSKDHPMNGQGPTRPRMTHNPYNNDPGTPTAVPPPDHIRQGLYPLEWKTVSQPADVLQNPPQLRLTTGLEQHDSHHPDDGLEPPNSHPAADARHFGV
jgi:hypothetical protein